MSPLKSAIPWLCPDGAMESPAVSEGTSLGGKMPAQLSPGQSSPQDADVKRDRPLEWACWRELLDLQASGAARRGEGTGQEVGAERGP